jgi:fructose-1,6-bisphosphatase/inositol monophosphatase family enzyme
MDDLLAEMRWATGVVTETSTWLAAHRSGAMQLSHKTLPTDVVTDRDRTAEARIRAAVRARHRHDAFLGEEGGLVGAENARRRWVTDPLDGSDNYASGDIGWAVGLSCEDADGPLLAAVVSGDTGETFAAARGHGFYLNGELLYSRWAPGRALPVGPSLANARVEIPIWAKLVNSSPAAYAALQSRTGRTVSWGTTLAALGSVAAGRLSGTAVRWADDVFKPWDWCGALLVEEAGGVVGNLGAFSYAAARGCAAELRDCLTTAA